MSRSIVVLVSTPDASRLRGGVAHGAVRNAFTAAVDGAHRGKAKIKAGLIGDYHSDEWELPPKPKWMRWRTYDSLERKFDAYEAALHQLAADRLTCLIRRR